MCANFLKYFWGYLINWEWKGNFNIIEHIRLYVYACTYYYVACQVQEEWYPSVDQTWVWSRVGLDL